MCTTNISRYVLVLKIVFVCTHVACGLQFYITPGPMPYYGPCPNTSICVTFTAFMRYHVEDLSNTLNVSLVFFPGNYSLDHGLFLLGKNEIVMTSLIDDTVFIECEDQYGKFVIGNTTSVLMRGLHFIGCDSNRVFNTENLALEKITFQGTKASVSDSHPVNKTEVFALQFVNVKSVKIYQSTFVCTQRAVYIELSSVWIRSCQVLYNTGNATIDVHWSKLRCENSTFVHNKASSYYGQIVISNSNATIQGNTFYENTGGAIAVEHSKLQCENNTFTHNKLMSFASGLILLYNSTVTIRGSQFYKNEGTGALLIAFGITNINIHNCQFFSNKLNFGVMSITSSNITIQNSTCAGNYGKVETAVISSNLSTFLIQNSNFGGNYAEEGTGVIISAQSTFTIQNSSFIYNTAGTNGGGVLQTIFSNVTIQNCTFSHNQVYNLTPDENGLGGVIRSRFDTYFIVNSNFSNNLAFDSGVMSIATSFVKIVKCSLNNNMATEYSGLVSSIAGSTLEIYNSSMSNNTAEYVSGAIIVFQSSLKLSNSALTNNSAGHSGGVVFCSEGQVDVEKSTFNKNKAAAYGGIMFATNCNIRVQNSQFRDNFGSFYIFICQLNFTGSNLLECGSEITTKEHEGGAITSFESTVTFTGTNRLLKNTARNGGAILATASTIIMYDDITIANNSAVSNAGGGLFLRQSVLEVRGVCHISNNHALYGGGIQISGSYIFVYDQLTAGLHLSDNTAGYHGGGMHFKANSILYLLKYTNSNETDNLVSLSRNRAVYGGAVYVQDDSNSCLPSNDCFIQALSITPFLYDFLRNEDIVFSGNIATKRGSDLFGGQIQTCSVSELTNIFLVSNFSTGEQSYKNFTNITLDTIASHPVRLCFCTRDGQPDCEYNPPLVYTKKGESFTVSLVAVDQVNHTVDASIISSLSSSNGGFGEGQQTQKVRRNCTELHYSVLSPENIERITLFAGGPCADSEGSIRYIDVHFINCTCPIGFEPSANTITKCECICDTKLSQYLANCNSSTESLLLKGDAWIFYSNETDPPGYIVHPHCPFDYCHSPSKNIRINLNLPNGADSQCAYDRRGVLCGSCGENFSLSLGSSRCLHCQDHWPAVFVATVLAAMISGILLVVFMLILNFTVTVGLINGLIFYANILASSSAVFFPQSKSTFLKAFVAWLNLDIGIDVCFIKGLDTYTKTWLQLAFPVYIISLVVMVIVISQHSLRFTRLIGKKNPVATLATLILLSYAKLLSTTITILSYAILHYPDGSKATVWLPDGSVKYFQGKHAALCIAAVFIILLGVPYTLLLFLWQWLVRVPKWKVFKWTRNTKLNAFIATYHAPYNSKYRYWTGLLLLVRVILYVTASVTAFSTPQSLPLITAILTGGLLFLKGVIGAKVYKKSIIDIFDTVINLNLLVFAMLTLYNFKSDVIKQTAIAYISTMITLFLLLGAITYHVVMLIIISKKKETMSEVQGPPPPQSRSATVAAIVTHSSIELPPFERKLNSVALQNRIECNTSDTEDHGDRSAQYHAMI